MIRLRTCALFLMVACGPVAAQEPRPFPKPAGEPMVTLEARWLTMPVGFCDSHLPAGAGAGLPDNELLKFVADWTGAPITDAQVAPLMSVPSGREASVQINDTRLFVTSLKACVVGGTPVLVPQNQPVELGPVVTVRPTVSADGKA